MYVDEIEHMFFLNSVLMWLKHVLKIMGKGNLYTGFMDAIPKGKL